MKIIRKDKDEIWFDNQSEAEQYCYDHNLWTIGIEFTMDIMCRKWWVVSEHRYTQSIIELLI